MALPFKEMKLKYCDTHNEVYAEIRVPTKEGERLLNLARIADRHEKCDLWLEYILKAEYCTTRVRIYKPFTHTRFPGWTKKEYNIAFSMALNELESRINFIGEFIRHQQEKVYNSQGLRSRPKQ